MAYTMIEVNVVLQTWVSWWRHLERLSTGRSVAVVWVTWRQNPPVQLLLNLPLSFRLELVKLFLVVLRLVIFVERLPTVVSFKVLRLRLCAYKTNLSEWLEPRTIRLKQSAKLIIVPVPKIRPWRSSYPCFCPFL